MQIGYMGFNSKRKLQDYAGMTCDNKLLRNLIHGNWQNPLQLPIYTNKFNSFHDIRYIPMREDDASWLDVNEDIFKKIKQEKF